MFYNKIPINRCLTAGLASEEMRTSPLSVYHTVFPAHLSRLPPPSPPKHAPLASDVRHPPFLDGSSVLQQSQETVTSTLLAYSIPPSPSTLADIFFPPSKFTRDQLVRNLQVPYSIHSPFPYLTSTSPDPWHSLSSTST